MSRRLRYIFVSGGAVLFILLFAMSIIYGQQVRNSYTNDVQFQNLLKNKELKVLYYHYPFDKQYDVYGGGQSVSSLQDIEKTSDLIVKARVTPNSRREIYEECILSQAQVVKRYKGDIGTQKEISIFEPVNCTGIKGMLLCSEGYSPIKEGKEYILFLKRLKNSLFGKDSYVYIPSTLTFSKYAAGKDRPHKLSREDLEVGGSLYSEIEYEEVFLFRTGDVKLFSEIKEQVLKKY